MGDLAGKGPLGLKRPKEPKLKRKWMRTKKKRVTLEKLNPEHMAKVAQLPCVICGSWPVEVHHVCCGRYGQAKAPDEETIPLCWNHHLGPEGIHPRKKWWVEQFGPDTDYVKAVKARVKEIP